MRWMPVALGRTVFGMQVGQAGAVPSVLDVRMGFRESQEAELVAVGMLVQGIAEAVLKEIAGTHDVKIHPKGYRRCGRVFTLAESVRKATLILMDRKKKCWECREASGV